MSTTGTSMPLAIAEMAARRILAQIDGEGYIVGSVRRRKAQVGDIEIALHDDAIVRLEVGEDLFPAEWRNVKGGKRGWKYWQVEHVELGYKVDLFRFNDRNRGAIMLIRTGPADFSRRFVMALRQRELCHFGGYICSGTEIVPCPDEHEAFNLAGMRYIKPEQRR